MRKAPSSMILRNAWMILALVVVLAMVLSINWYYFHRVRARLDAEFNIRLESLAALVSTSIDTALVDGIEPVDPLSEGAGPLLGLLEDIRSEFELSDILLLREDGVILLALETSLYRPGDFYPVYNMDYESIVAALDGRPSATRLARVQGGELFKAGYAPFPLRAREARSVTAVEADAGFLGGVSDLRNMLSAATAVSILGLVVFVWFVLKATSSLLAARESLMRSETLASMGRMAAGIAHEVRNPLFIIRSSAERLRSEHPESAEEIDEFIIDESDRLDGILSTYLQFAAGEKSSPREADLSLILRRSVRLIGENRGPEDPAIGITVEEGGYPLRCDEKRLQQVFMNILLNAVRFTGRDGSVHARLGRVGNDYVVSVEDTGEGIPQADIDEIFEPFYTTRSDGSGLGLAVARRITLEHGGEIRVDSIAGEGTRVSVVLPASGMGRKEDDEQDPDSR